MYELIGKVEDSIVDSHQAGIDREALNKEIENISYIKNRLKLIITEQSNLLLKQQELQRIYDEAVDNILYIGFENRLNFEETVIKKMEENPDLAYPLIKILRPLFKPELDKIFNIKKALKEQRIAATETFNEGSGILMSERYFNKLESENDIKIRNTNERYLDLFEIICKNALAAPDKQILLSKLRNGAIVNLSSVESGKFIDLINSLDINKSSIHGGVFEIPLNRCLYIDHYLREKGVENFAIESRLGRLLKSVSNPGEAEVVLGEALKGVLRSYQVTGVKWLKTMAGYSFGGILADDMGLGKTLQVLAFIAGEKDRKLPCMVVAPTSIVYNWRMEAKKFVPGLKVLVVTGAKDKRTLLICGSNEVDLVITSYGARVQLKKKLPNSRKEKGICLGTL